VNAVSKKVLLTIGLLVACFDSHAKLARREWKIDGVTREALVYTPDQKPQAAAGFPVVFVFHGHGGSMSNAMRSFSIHTRWPDSIVIYMQGLPTPGRLTDPDGKAPGWQKEIGDQKDRDLKFFDALLTDIEKENPVDNRRIYSTGHSNGGAFTYLLWAARGDEFAAMAPSAAAAGPSIRLLKPKPLFHLGAENDPLVKFEWQKATITAVRRINDCREGKSWHDKADCTIYPSSKGAPVITYIHDRRHSLPTNAPDLIVQFFKEYTAQ
jgi:polyhydroxybutyrate depolymerase